MSSNRWRAFPPAQITTTFTLASTHTLSSLQTQAQTYCSRQSHGRSLVLCTINAMNEHLALNDARTTNPLRHVPLFRHVKGGISLLLVAWCGNNRQKWASLNSIKRGVGHKGTGQDGCRTYLRVVLGRKMILEYETCLRACSRAR
jgi:hypothetical protein